MKSQNFPELAQFFGAYFHQDCLVDDPTDIAIVHRFVTNEPPEFVSAVHKELVALHAQEVNEDVLTRVITRDFGAFYNPRPSGLSYQQWLVRLIHAIEVAK